MPPTPAILGQIPLGVLQHAPTMVFLFAVGACVGSFLNVVVYRLPAGMSVISPPSRCPTCGARLRFFRENLPILGWFMVRGKCRYCRAPVSPQYMIIELIMALVFAGLYAALFFPGSPITNDWWLVNGFWLVWPAWWALAVLVAGLIAMTLIDARTFTIPIEIPLFVTITAFIAWPVQALLPTKSWVTPDWPIPGASWPWCLAAGLGALGVLVGVVLLKVGRIRYSFHDYDDYVKEGETLGDYPHARREMGLELLFLAPCLAGVVGGLLLGGKMPAGSPPVLVQAIGATLIGYLSGCALIWGIRILGTLAFGREAMGLGDVHLLGAVGAVLGWFDPILVFFIAPFSGLLWAALSVGLEKVSRTPRRELPYGPHLALATIIVILGRPWIVLLWTKFLSSVPFPGPGLV